MVATINKTLRQLRSTRDLRAEMLSLAAELASGNARGRLTVVAPVIAPATVQGEWGRLLPVISQDVRDRMSLRVESDKEETSIQRPLPGVALLDRPNYRFEIIRLLVGANLEGVGPQLIQGLMGKIGASQTPIRQALGELKQAGVVHSWGRGIEVAAEEISNELLAKIRALPQTLRFRFERGAQIRTPAALLQRVLPLLQPGAPAGWQALSLSGVAVAQAQAPDLDLIGLPRLDLVAHIKRDAKAFDTSIVRLLDDGLELEPNVLAPVPVAITLVRAEAELTCHAGLGPVRCACPMDVFLSLLDLGLRDQALRYARTIRPSALNQRAS